MKNILVLEDDANLRELILEGLQEVGYQPTGAASGQEALALARRQAFDLVVADVRMEGMDGIQCLVGLREIQPGARRLVITGYASQDAPARAVQAEAEDYLHKPFRMAALLQSIQRILASEQEGGRYQGLLASVVAGYRKLVEKAGTAIARAELAWVDPDRDLAFQGFYVGIRSGMLGRRDALTLWERLEQLETEREQLKSPGAHPQKPQELVAGYRYLLELLRAVQKSGTWVLAGGTSGLDKRQFAHLMRGIQQGDISAEQLKIAPYLRQLDPRTRSGSEELESLYRTLWGP